MPTCTRDSVETSLPDVQSESPAYPLHLTGVGVVGMRVPVALDFGTALCTLSAMVDVPAHQRGAHMSRFAKALARVPAGLSASRFVESWAESVRRLQVSCAGAAVSVDVDVPVGATWTTTRWEAVSGTPEAVAPAPTGTSLSLEVLGSTVCPCAYAMSGNRYAHVQRASLRVRMVRPTIGAAELHTLLEGAFSAPVAMVLDRPGEKALVDRMFAQPRFVEDVARSAVELLRAAQAGAWASVEATAYESIHPYDCAARWQGVL